MRKGAGVLTNVGLGLCVALTIVAPLAVGGVHNLTLLLLIAAGGLGVLAMVAGLALQGRHIRLGVSVLVPLAFLAVPLLQIVPLPLGIRNALDPAGTALLRDNGLLDFSSWPLSLDPVTTRIYVARTALALVVFIVSHHLASGQTRRYLVTRIVAAAGLTAVAIGLGHRIFSLPKLYGLFNSTGRTLLTGPFVNSNHTAELLELSAFACLACSFQRHNALNRIGWLVGTVMCLAGALATLSRGVVAALAVAVPAFVLLRYLSREQAPGSRRREALAWGLFLVAVIGLGAVVLGTGALLDRFRAEAFTSDVRFQLWREGLRVFEAHPLGIGRGAFDRAFPIYRTFKTSNPLRFAFVENEPLQLLIDSGWPLFALLAVAMTLVIWQVARHGRRDKIEAALVAGLVAVLAHSLVDFGLETPGVLLPFVAILATVLGRLRKTTLLSPRPTWAVLAIAGVALVIGAGSLRSSSANDFDALLRRSATKAEQRELLVRAQAAHPFDYFYPLTFARLEPLKGPPGQRSPRLRALNRALRLCPACEQVHQDVARNLWALGLRGQALIEWRSAVNIQPKLFTPALQELYGAGATPQELAAIAASEPARMIDIAVFLGGMGRTAEAFSVLDQADGLGVSAADSLLMRGKLQLDSGQFAPAAVTVAKAKAVKVDDPRLTVLEGRLLGQEAAGADEALAILDRGAVRHPDDLAIQRTRLDVVMRHEKWHAAARAVQGFELALYHAYGSAAEAHTAAARIDARLSRWPSALGKYRIALADQPNNVPLWLEYGRVAESSGRDVTAREAYTQAAHLSPQNPEVDAALRRIKDRQAKVRSLGPAGGVD